MKQHSHPVQETVPAAWGANEKAIARNCLTVLNRHYPGHRWGVGVNKERDGGWVALHLADVPTQQYFHINYRDLDPEYRVVMRGGGLLLEALKLHRGKADFEALDHLSETPEGLVFVDPDAMPATNPGYAAVRAGFERMNRDAA